MTLLSQSRLREISIQIPELTVNQNLIVWFNIHPCVGQDIRHTLALGTDLHTAPVGLHDHRARQPNPNDTARNQLSVQWRGHDIFGMQADITFSQQSLNRILMGLQLPRLTVHDEGNRHTGDFIE